MSEMICKNCGKQIMKLRVSGDYWVHVGELLRECYPDIVAESEEEKCDAEITINHQIYKCEREYGHVGFHQLEFHSDVLSAQGIMYNKFEIKW